MIRQSIACTVTQGREMRETMGFTGINYDYNVSANKNGQLCCLSMSIHKGVEFLTPISCDELVERGQQLIQNMLILKWRHISLI